MKLPRGITETESGYRVFAQFRLVARRKRFPRTATIHEMQEWQKDEKARIRLGLEETERAAPPPGFRADAATYLRAVKALPTYDERARDIGLWVEEFGDRPRAEIRPVEIRAVRERWLTIGPKMVQTWVKDSLTGRKVRKWVPSRAPLSASTVNHRLRALENLWTVLDGRHAPNPVREVPEAEEPEAPPRALPIAIIRRILDAMPRSKTKARLEVLAWTGIPPKTLERMNETMIDWDSSSVWVPGRRKGKGTEGRRVPLTPDGVKAFRAVIQENAFTHASDSKASSRRMMRSACAVVQRELAKEKVKVDLSQVRPYDLRHSIGTLTYAQTGDFKATSGLLGVSGKTAERYARGAIDPRLATAAATLARAQKLPAKPPAKRKPAKDA